MREAEASMQIVLVDSHSDFTGEETDSDRPSHLPRVTQLVNSRVRIRSLPPH